MERFSACPYTTKGFTSDSCCNVNCGYAQKMEVEVMKLINAVLWN